MKLHLVQIPGFNDHLYGLDKDGQLWWRDYISSGYSSTYIWRRAVMDMEK